MAMFLIIRLMQLLFIALVLSSLCLLFGSHQNPLIYIIFYAYDILS